MNTEGKCNVCNLGDENDNVICDDCGEWICPNHLGKEGFASSTYLCKECVEYDKINKKYYGKNKK
jgi:ribosomal protein L32